jgi:quercetin dioxygenase-like cupin family protein
MKPVTVVMSAVLTLLAAGWFAPRNAVAQDAVTVAPKIYSVVFENDRVRVLDYHAKPGQKAAMHSHPALISYALTAAKVKFTSPDGKSQDQALKTGQVLWRDAETHATENIGKTPAHVLVIELKK